MQRVHLTWPDGSTIDTNSSTTAPFVHGSTAAGSALFIVRPAMQTEPSGPAAIRSIHVESANRSEKYGGDVASSAATSPPHDHAAAKATTPAARTCRRSA